LPRKKPHKINVLDLSELNSVYDDGGIDLRMFGDFAPRSAP